MKILRSRSFQRKPPSKDAKTIFIFCEGNRKENKYFKFFQELDSKINVQIFEPQNGDDNSPTGLYEKAKSIIKGNDKKSSIEVLEDDEVWFVVDTDDWGEKLVQLYEKCELHINWFVAESNPCFELWLYFHLFEKLPEFDGMEKSENWKEFLNGKIKGGFDSRKHPFLIEEAIKNSQANYEDNDTRPNFRSTSVHKLAETIHKLTKESLDKSIE